MEGRQDGIFVQGRFPKLADTAFLIKAELLLLDYLTEVPFKMYFDWNIGRSAGRIGP